MNAMVSWYPGDSSAFISSVSWISVSINPAVPMTPPDQQNIWPYLLTQLLQLAISVLILLPVAVLILLDLVVWLWRTSWADEVTTSPVRQGSVANTQQNDPGIQSSSFRNRAPRQKATSNAL